MKILLANLKHFYQCRALWFFYLYLAPSAYFSTYIMAKLQTPRSFVVFFAASFVVGFVTANLQQDVLTKPFSFCMPDHGVQSRHLILGIGATLGLLAGTASLIVFFLSHGHKPETAALLFWAVSFMAMMCYLLGIWFVFARNNIAFIGTFVLVLLALISMDLILRLIEYVIASAPLLPISAGILACGIAWKWLGDRSLARKYCGQDVMGFMNISNMARMRQIQQKKTAEMLSKRGPSTIVDHLEEFFISKMEASRPFSKNRYLLGNLYIMFGKFFGPWWGLNPIMAVALLLYFGYLPSEKTSYMLFSFPAFALVLLDLIPYRSMLLPSGRREKYYNALIMGFGEAVLFTLTLLAMSALSIPLSEVMPDITVKSIIFDFHPIDASMFYLCPVLVPVAMVVGTLFSRKRLTLLASSGILMVLVILVMMGLQLEGIIAALWPGDILGPITLIAISWTGSAALLRYHCRKQNLVGQGR